MKRFEYVDIAKGIGILLVVYAHIMLVGWSHRLIYAFHMPLFFFISGYLFNPRKFFSFKEFIKKRFFRLLVPYFFYSIATWIIWAGFRYVQGSEVHNYWSPLLQTVLAQGSGAFLVHNSALWFIPCLFAVETMYYFICKLKERLALVLCFIIAGIGVALAAIFGEDYLFLLPWNLDAAFYALPFYGVANVIRNHYNPEQVFLGVHFYKKTFWSLTMILWILLWILAMNFGECSMGSSSYQCNMGIFFIRAFLGCFALILLSVLFCGNSAQSETKHSVSHSICQGLQWCGKNSLDIMCLHIPIKGVMVLIISRLLHPSIDVSSSGVLSLCAFLLSMIVIVPNIVVINKYLHTK